MSITPVTQNVMIEFGKLEQRHTHFSVDMVRQVQDSKKAVEVLTYGPRSPEVPKYGFRIVEINGNQQRRLFSTATAYSSEEAALDAGQDLLVKMRNLAIKKK